MLLAILVVSTNLVTGLFGVNAPVSFSSIKQDKRVVDPEARSYRSWYDAFKQRDLSNTIKLGGEFLQEYPYGKYSDYVRKIINFARISLDEGKRAQAIVLGNEFRASLSEETARLEVLLNEALSGRIDVNTRTESGRNALMYAAATADVEAVKELINKDAEIEAVETSHGWTALTFAIWSNDRNVVTRLVEYFRQNNSMKDKDGRTALDHAVLTADFEIILLILSGGGGDFGKSN